MYLISPTRGNHLSSETFTFVFLAFRAATIISRSAYSAFLRAQRVRACVWVWRPKDQTISDDQTLFPFAVRRKNMQKKKNSKPTAP